MKDERWSLEKAIAVSTVIGTLLWVVIIYGFRWVLQ